MSLDTLTNALRHIRLPHSQQDRLNLALGTAAVLGSAFLLPAAYRDYRIFKSYGPGGVPNNVLGWMTVRALFQPFGSEMFSTEVYVRRIDAAEGHGRGDDGYLTLSTEQLESRKKEGRPEVGPHVVPQRQLTQFPDEDVMDVRLHAPALRDSGKSVVANLCSWGRRCRNSTPNSLRSVCATTTSSSSSNPISSATLMRFSWPITSPLRISRRRYMVKSRIYTVEMTTQFIWSWRRRIVSTKLGRVIIVRGCSRSRAFVWTFLIR
jgi:hypothetical protein